MWHLGSVYYRCLGLVCGLLMVGLQATAYSAEPATLQLDRNARPLTVVSKPLPIQDDAQLRDVCLVDSQVGYTVGDQGAIWKTEDGGETWQWVQTRFGYSFTDVCFLTRKTGWIAGRGIHPYGQEGWGVLLRTKDGGKTFERLPTNQLPPLNAIQFFDLEHGIAVGEASSQYPSGVLQTSDGGKTWQAKTGLAGKNWLAASFTQFNRGMVAGPLGQLARADEEKIALSTFSQFDLRAIRDISLSAKGNNSWLVGEGAFLFHSTDAGAHWNEPTGKLPTNLRQMQDFHSVAQHGDHVWVAGTPGTVIWHSPDAGITWEPQYTSQSVPIQKIEFNSEQHGCAVGTLGTILTTHDGGQNWKVVKGAARRVALLQVATAPEKIDLNLLAQQSAERGYRSLVYLPVRKEVSTKQYTGKASAVLRSNSAVLNVHGSQALTAWQFPLVRPDLELNQQGLINELSRWSDGRLPQVLGESLVCLIRTWRPEVIVLPAKHPEQQVDSLFQQAFHEAVNAAADPTQFLEQQEVLGLKPWRVKRVFQQSVQGATGDVQINPYEMLARKHQTITDFTAPARRQVGLDELSSIRPQHYDFTRYVPNSKSNKQSPKNFFAGLALAPGGEARREIETIDERQLAKAKQIAQRQKQIATIAEHSLLQNGHADQMLSEMRQSLRGFSPTQSAEQLVHLAKQYQKQGWLVQEETVLTELINLYPAEPVTAQAIKRLFLLWTSTEIAWQRSKQAVVKKVEGDFDQDEQQRLIQQANALRGNRPEGAPPQLIKGEKDPYTRNSTAGTLKIGTQQNWRTGRVKMWREQAVRLAQYIEQADPYQFHTPEIQFPLAGLLSGMSDKQRKHFEQAEATDIIKLSELQGAVARPSIACRKTKQRPHLDGLLSDACWKKSVDIVLKEANQLEQADDDLPLIMVTYDDDYFYMAAVMPKEERLPQVEMTTAGRKHDQAAAGFDRLLVSIDLDSDYQTYYQITIDQRGLISESCFGDAKWNPKMHVAVQQDATHWRFEAAIPMTEICPHAPKTGQSWALSLQRIMPAVGLQSWSHPTSTTPMASSFGAVRFAD